YLILLPYIVLFASIPAQAQIGSGVISGTIRDDSGSPLPGVSVFLKNAETGAERSEISDESGEYKISFLAPGTYEATAEVTGFATVIHKDIHLELDRTVILNFKMKLSVTGETIEVTGEHSWIESDQSHIITYINHEQIKRVPIISRQCMQLAALAPGTTSISFPDPTKVNSEAISIGGGTGRGVHVSVDGGDNNDDTIGGTELGFSLESIAQIS